MQTTYDIEVKEPTNTESHEITETQEIENLENVQVEKNEETIEPISQENLEETKAINQDTLESPENILKIENEEKKETVENQEHLVENIEENQTVQKIEENKNQISESNGIIENLEITQEKEIKLEEKVESERTNKLDTKITRKIQDENIILEIMELPKQEEPKKNLAFLKKYKNEKKEEIVDVQKRKQILDELVRVEKEYIDEDQEFNGATGGEEEEENQLQFKPAKSLNIEDFKNIKSKEGYLTKATPNNESGHIRYIVASKGVNKVLVTVWNNDKGPKSMNSPIQKLYINQNVIQEKYPFKTLKKTSTVEKNVSFIHSLEFIPIHGGPKDRVRLWASNEKEAKEWEISIRAMLFGSMEETKSIEKPVENPIFVEKKTSEIQPTTSTNSNSGRVGKLKGFFSKLITNSEKEDNTTKKKSFSFLKK
jgi:hypothetical protein